MSAEKREQNENKQGAKVETNNHFVKIVSRIRNKSIGLENLYNKQEKQIYNFGYQPQQQQQADISV